MKRLMRFLLLAVLLTPPVAEVVTAHETFCEEREACCPQEDACDANCLRVCCAHHPVLALTASASQVIEAPPARPGVAGVVAPPSAPSADILHVPKSS